MHKVNSLDEVTVGMLLYAKPNYKESNEMDGFRYWMRNWGGLIEITYKNNFECRAQILNGFENHSSIVGYPLNQLWHLT